MCILFRRKQDNNYTLQDIFMNETKLCWNDSVKHLGHKLSFDLSNEKDLCYARSIVIVLFSSK